MVSIVARGFEDLLPCYLVFILPYIQTAEKSLCHSQILNFAPSISAETMHSVHSSYAIVCVANCSKPLLSVWIFYSAIFVNNNVVYYIAAGPCRCHVTVCGGYAVLIGGIWMHWEDWFCYTIIRKQNNA